MLGRAADNIYWMGRYIERAGNTARLMRTGVDAQKLNLGTTPRYHTSSQLSDWDIPLVLNGCRDDFIERYREVSPGRVLAYMILDKHNPGSIRYAVNAARENARATRHLLTNDVWEALNQTYLTLADFDYDSLNSQGMDNALEWVSHRGYIFHGAVQGSMRRGEAYHFAQLGAAIEKVDFTARLLGLKAAHMSVQGVDYYRAVGLLKSLSALQSYREVYRANIEFRKIADLLIRRRDMPRSLLAGVQDIIMALRALNDESEVLKTVGAMHHRLTTVNIGDLVRVGLTGFLNDFSKDISTVSEQLQKEFMMVQ